MFSVEQALTSGLLQLFAGVFVAGVATSFTPCVYPMIPITMGIFGANQAKNRLRAVGLAACYVGGIALTYTMLGLFVAFGGRSAGALLASRSFIIPLSAFLLILATSLLGLWKFHIPASIANRLSRVGGAGWIGAFFMGLVGGLIITPCTGPVLAGLLTLWP